ncbi:DUF3291 domain-containing protein [Sedimentitalea todarodis]|uniref:DUF3291 domain-containing protein n=1 Tax=Sedimentitalea todarodis TaxID=1631240 RepID=A0ABU3V911_9RHOB|nr:DUF3291 domain-containing protein [Sedimentitalea todarodis]MDU9002658.1 DUF3291 domain-containing protein [Sedimentitalea todarodis]
MSETQTYHLAELNIGRLLAPTDDPRVAEFMANLDRINGLGKRMPGFVWMMEGSGEPGTGNTENSIGGDPQFVANLTVWEDVAALEKFVWGTVHKQFYDKRQQWFDILADQHFVMWWVPVGHRPTLDEAMARLEHMRDNGPDESAFGWAQLEQASMWRGKRCTPVAAK